MMVMVSIEPELEQLQRLIYPYMYTNIYIKCNEYIHNINSPKMMVSSMCRGYKTRAWAITKAEVGTKKESACL
jgi:hypothetical protein